MNFRGIDNNAPTAEGDSRPSRGWVRRHPVVSAFLLLVVLLVAAVWIAHNQAERALARRIAAIRARGEPVTIQDMITRREKIPDEENMLAALLTTGKSLAAIKLTVEEKELLPYLGNAL